jgi:hypothetical protein
MYWHSRGAYVLLLLLLLRVWCWLLSAWLVGAQLLLSMCKQAAIPTCTLP